MKTIKQPWDSKLCLAACCAMIAGTTLDEVLAETTLHDDGYLTTKEAIIFLAKHNLMFGTFFELDFANMGKVPELVKIDFPMASAPAIVTVQSDAYGGCNHAAVWDNEVGMFRDPNPGYGDLTFPIKYKIREWWPIIKISENC